jgi:hypothetical protein
MKVKVFRIAAALGVVTALGTAAVPAASAARGSGGIVSGGIVSPPWATYCVDDFGSCAPAPGPFAL